MKSVYNFIIHVAIFLFILSLMGCGQDHKFNDLKPTEQPIEIIYENDETIEIVDNDGNKEIIDKKCLSQNKHYGKINKKGRKCGKTTN